jgi:hypothetical protein
VSSGKKRRFDNSRSKRPVKHALHMVSCKEQQTKSVSSPLVQHTRLTRVLCSGARTDAIRHASSKASGIFSRIFPDSCASTNLLAARAHRPIQRQSSRQPVGRLLSGFPILAQGKALIWCQDHHIVSHVRLAHTRSNAFLQFTAQMFFSQQLQPNGQTRVVEPVPLVLSSRRFVKIRDDQISGEGLVQDLNLDSLPLSFQHEHEKGLRLGFA